MASDNESKPHSLSTSRSPRATDDHLVVFEEGDPANPRNWPSYKKWLIVIAIIPIDLCVSFAASGFSPAESAFTKEFDVSEEIGTLGLSLYVLGLALGPMALAPLSEYFGRNPLYMGTWVFFLCFLVGTAVVQNLAGFFILRFLSGFFSAVTIANFGGSIADLWETKETGVPMSAFLWAATVGSPLGFMLLSFVAATRYWRNVFWATLGISGGFWIILVAVLLFTGETRHSVILRRRAAKLRKETGDDRYEVPDEMKAQGPAQLFKISLSRPFRFLFTEAIIIFGALYNGYLYGLSFLFNSAFNLVFGEMGHALGDIGVGLSFLGIIIGVSIGPFTWLWQERYYHRAVAARNGVEIPEARVQLSQVAGITFPISLFWFAWTTFTSIHWIVPILASALWGWSFYTLILMTYLYTEDSYKQFSASALAGLGLIRNLAGAGFPLFGRQLFMFASVDKYQWGATILAFLAVCMVPIPFILVHKGRELRKRSPWASQHMQDLSEGETRNSRQGDATVTREKAETDV